MAWVEIHDFSYTYPGEQLPSLRDINLTIHKNEFVVVAGASGSGKSTLGKALAGFLFQDEEPNFTGSIFVNRTDMTQVPLYSASQRVAYVQQNPEDQFCTLTVLDEIAFGLENACMSPDEIERRTDRALAVVQGQNLRDRQLATLSGGEKQKIAIATMLALEPDVLILDEPTSNLDPQATQHVFDTLHGLKSQTDLTVIIIEHKLSQLRSLNPICITLEGGKVISEQHLNERAPAIIASYTHHTKNKVAPAEQAKRPLLDVKNLHLNLNGHAILHDITFRLVPGELVAVMGPNGSGKSTLLRTLMGFHQPQQGLLTAFGGDLAQTKTSALVKDIGFIFQNPDHQLFTQSVWDEATLLLKNLKLDHEENLEIARASLSEIGLVDRLGDHPQRLSYGEKRRLNLLAVILHKPALLLIDEFLIGQDIANAHKWMRVLRDHADQGHAILLVNHHADLTKAYCDRVIFLDAGKLILDEPASTAFETLAGKGFGAFLPRQEEGCVHA
jgi:energy-coupling factor transport system ATP-binding protein